MFPTRLGQILLVVASVVSLLSSVQLSVLVWSEVQNTMQWIHLVDLRRPSLQELASVSASVDSITNSLAYATTLSTNARATGRILHMSNSRCLSRTAREFCNHARNQSFNAIRSTAYCAPTRSCAQRASTALMAATPMRTTSKPNTTNNFMPFKTILAEPRKSWAQTRRTVNGIITSNRKWQHARR